MSDPIKYKVIQTDYLAADKNCLLDYLESLDLTVHYHCRDGYCGACRTVLVEGDVHYPKEPLAFVRRGEILPCCCTPKSDLIIEAYPKSEK
ncbi:class I ribonucleotide reductase maintenance protein YfaE [Catenovulum sp. 2E275]|uniref:class I ribonucleotide reductase maintenance protein YfaE n=1 Tax=Catenovulum sp. 2E275 TaxID=2980497 RepID=UPI0021D26920|nr:class I ribonucleotide reductase maintenance protein YfaE [Catenovulum sp. 2E275]MCU4674482.1 class I ribonucleotide reductase maintenance protein YfaE [Catenovulum sp. 2E275]